MIQKAIILAAGKGSRMKELTHETPKPMLSVQGKPILEHIIEGLRDAGGIREFFIVIGYLGDQIQNYFGNGQSRGVQISYGIQTVQDGTGKAPELAKEWIGNNPFLFTYGDILVPAPEYHLLLQDFHTDGRIALKSGQDLQKGGAVVLNDQNHMIDLIEKGQFTTPPKNAHYNAGIYVLTPDIFRYTQTLQKSPRNEYEFTDALKNWVQSGAIIEGHFIENEWVDVRDPEILEQLNRSKQSDKS